MKNLLVGFALAAVASLAVACAGSTESNEPGTTSEQDLNAGSNAGSSVSGAPKQPSAASAVPTDATSGGPSASTSSPVASTSGGPSASTSGGVSSTSGGWVSPPATPGPSSAVCSAKQKICTVIGSDGNCHQACVDDTVMCAAHTCPVACDPPASTSKPNASCQWDATTCDWSCAQCDPSPKPGPSCQWDSKACVWLCL